MSLTCEVQGFTGGVGIDCAQSTEEPAAQLERSIDEQCVGRGQSQVVLPLFEVTPGAVDLKRYSVL